MAFSNLYETLPTPVVGSFGQSVSLSDILTQEFGPKYGGYTDFYLSYYGADTLAQYDFKYWTDTPGSSPSVDTVTTWLQKNGAPLGPTDPEQEKMPAANFTVNIPGTNVVHVTASNIDQFSLQIGSNIGPLAFISVPIAVDSANNPTEYAQYSITTVDPSLYHPTSTPTPSDIVAEAYAYASKYQNVENNNDCHFIAQDVAAAIGAPLDDPTGGSDPGYNVQAGFWGVFYRSPEGGTPDWSRKVEPGDIVRMHRTPTITEENGIETLTDNGSHTFIVLNTQPAGDGIHYLLTVYDNGDLGEIGVHYDWVPPDPNASPNSDDPYTRTTAYYHYYDDEASDVTIYRLTTDDKYLVDETQLGISDTPNLGSRLVGTANDDDIIAGADDDIISSWIGNDVIDGSGGLNTLDYSWDINPVSVDLWAGTAAKGSGWTDQFVKIQSFIGGSSNDVFYGRSGTYTFDGGGKEVNTLDYSSSKNAFHVIVDLAQHTVTKTTSIYMAPQTDSFINIQSFVGTSGNDSFKSTLPGSFTFDGGDGNNTLDYSAIQSGVTVSLQQVGGTVEKGVSVSNSRGSFSLISYPTDNFSNIQHFIGGAGDDTFKVVPDNSDYTLDGGSGGFDTLDYSAFTYSKLTPGITFDLQQQVVHKGSAQKVSGPDANGVYKTQVIKVDDNFFDIDAFKGGSGDDTLIDRTATTKQFFDGGAGNNTVVLSGTYSDYDLSASGYGSDLLWHTVVNPIASTDAPLDLVHVGQLQFADGSSTTLADHGMNLAPSALFTTAQSGAISKYQFWDSTADPASGHFVVNGVVQAKGQAIDVDASQQSQTTFQSGSGSNDLWVRTFDGIQWSAWQEFRVNAPLNRAPVVTASDHAVAHGASIAASSLLSVSDADGDLMSRYQFWDATVDPASGHFVVNGVAQAKGQAIDVSASQLGQTTFQSGSGANDLWVRAFDGMSWSAWKELHVNAPVDTGPAISASNLSLGEGHSAIAASSLFTATTPFGDPISKFAFWDTGTGGGHFLINGVAQATGTEIDISSAQLSQVTYQAGSSSDTLWVRANDGYVWGTWSQAFTVNPWVDSAPTITASNVTAAHGQSFTVSSLFGASDADGDTITKYALWNTGAGGGHFVLNGVAQGTSQEIDVSASQLSQLTYQSGSGADTLWVRANDGMLWGNWSNAFSVSAPIDTGPVVTPTNASIRSFPDQTFAASSLISYTDPFGSPATQYNFWNSGAGGGHFLLNGSALPANQDNIVSAAQLSQLTYQVGTGSDTLWARANDGTVWGGWSKSFTISDPPAVGAGETITLGSAYAGEVGFLSDTGTLKLEDSSSFAGTVAGLCGHDAIDLADIGFGANSTLGYAANADNSGGTLSVGDGVHMANIALLGSYMASMFVAASDGHGGTLISETAQSATQMPVVTQPHA